MSLALISSARELEPGWRRSFRSTVRPSCQTKARQSSPAQDWPTMHLQKADYSPVSDKDPCGCGSMRDAWLATMTQPDGLRT